MAERLALDCMANRASFCGLAIGFYPGVSKRLALSCLANRTSFGCYTIRIRPGVGQSFPFGCLTKRAGFGGGAGCCCPLMFAFTACGQQKYRHDQNEQNRPMLFSHVVSPCRLVFMYFVFFRGYKSIITKLLLKNNPAKRCKLPFLFCLRGVFFCRQSILFFIWCML